MLKKSLFLFLVVLLLLMTVLLSIRFNPSLVLSAVSMVTEYQIRADKLNLTFFPLKISSEALQVKTEKNRSIASFGVANIEYDWWAKLLGKRADWIGKVVQGKINLAALPLKTSEVSESTEGGQPIDVHALLTLFAGEISDVRIVFDEEKDNYLHINQLSALLSATDKNSTNQNLEQVIDVNMTWGNTNKPIEIQGRLKSFYQASSPTLQLDLTTLNLTPLVSGEGNDIVTEESAIDWLWLSRFNKLIVLFSVEKIQLNENTISQLNLHLSIEGGIEILQIGVDVHWKLSENLYFDDSLILKGYAKPLGMKTLGKDLHSSIELQSSKATLKLTGDININGIDENIIELKMDVQELPFTGLNFSAITQYLPLSLSSKLIVDTDRIEVKLTEGQFGNSDVAGKVIIDKFTSVKPSIDINLRSGKLSYVSDEQPTAELTEQDKPIEKLFNDTPIDWQWLHDYQLNADLQIAELDYAGLLFQDVNLPVTIEEGTLALPAVSAKLGEGHISGALSIIDEQTGLENQSPVEISATLTVQDAKLDALGLFSKEQIEGGLLNIDSKLSLQGNSSQQLANSTRGFVFVDASQSVIKSNSFELIGSDLLMEFLSKLNPFSKEDKHTDLECAVAYFPIEKGIFDLENAVAIKTSKIVITGDGAIDLSKEELNIKFTPTMRQGVGLNIGSLVKFVKLGGSLTQPRPALDAAGLLTTGLAASVAISTGGVSLLADGLVSKLTNDQACKQVKENYLKSKKNDLSL